MLTVLFGRSQSGKSGWIFAQLRAAAERGQGGRVLLVPEQFSHETERRLAASCGDSISRYAEALSFSRLSDRVFAACGGACVQSLDGGGRILAMAGALDQIRSRLKLFSAATVKPEFYTKLISAVDELKSYCVSADTLREAASALGGATAEKLEELALILEAYDAVCAAGAADPRDRLTRLCDRLLAEDWAEDRVFYVDSFTDFSVQELRVLEALLRVSGNLTVALTCDGADEGEPVFDQARQTLHTLRRMAEKMGEPVELHRFDGRPERPEGLNFLQERLFSAMDTQFPGEWGAVRLCVRADGRSECRAAAAELRQLVRTGARWRDCSVVLADASLEPAVQTVFDEFGIPYYLSGKADILGKPVMLFVTTALEAAVGGMEREDVIACLRTGLSPLTPEQIDLLDNYAFVWNLRGGRWEKPWRMHPDGFGKEKDEKSEARLLTLNAFREKAITPLLRLRDGLKAAANTGAQVLALNRFLEEYGLAAQLETLSKNLAADGQTQSAQEHARLYGILVEAMEQLYSVLGQTVRTPQSFQKLLKLELSQYDVGTIPAALDCVTVGSLMSMRSRAPRILFVLGASEGALPATAAPEGLLTEAERSALLERGVALAPGDEGRLEQQLSAIYSVLSSPQERLYISCGADSAPSYLFTRLETLFPQPETAEEPVYGDRRTMAAALASPETPQTLRQALCAVPALRGEAERLRARAAYTLGALSEQSVAALFGRRLRLSASRIESFESCRFSYFLQYGLRAAERKQADFDAPAFGTLVHAVLEKTVGQVMAAGGFHSDAGEQTGAFVMENAAAYTKERFDHLEEQSPRLQYLYNRNLQELGAVADSLRRELAASDFAPAACELSFSDGGVLPEIPVAGRVGQGALTGFVDRVDRYGDWIRIIDYKTGKKTFDYTGVYHGLGMQLLIYLFALENNGAPLFGTRTKGAGALYFPARDVTVKADAPLSMEEADRLRDKELRRQGLLLDDETLLHAMERSDVPTFLPYAVRKDGGRTGDLASGAQMELLRKHVEKSLAKLVDEMARGAVAPNPYVRGQISPCRWCPYGPVCRPDTCRVRYFKSLSRTEFWDRLEEDNHGE